MKDFVANNLHLYPLLALANRPGRGITPSIDLEFTSRHDYDRFHQNDQGNSLLMSWIDQPTSHKYVLSEALFHTFDSNETVRKQYFRQFSLMMPQVGLLIMPHGGQYLYEIINVPPESPGCQPGDKYMAVMYLVKRFFLSLEVGVLRTGGVDVIDPLCIYVAPELDRAMTISYVVVALQYFRGASGLQRSPFQVSTPPGEPQTLYYMSQRDVQVNNASDN